jgi:DNA-binding response OmpR family regulator
MVLLDLKLPKKNGLEVLEWIRGQAGLRTVAVIVLTSSPDARDARRAYELGANSYVIKPADLQKYAEFARRFKEWWLECNQFVAGDAR